MREEEAKAKILEQISITRQKVTIAKANLLELLSNHLDTSRLINTLLTNLDAQMPEKIIVNPLVDPLPNLAKAATSISWQVATAEAIWELIHDNYIIPASSDLIDNSIDLAWTTVYENSGGHSSGWTFNEFAIPVPEKSCYHIPAKTLNFL